ncbi:MAG: CoB--CoM heterodisulfide reductase iron-sulfur subunit A family protein [Theionarchaea archaeon]|nr:CoB--CoM heterodisulfide reductase iron-sulfur subunit A family protein [Theionarchaea archaeon]MBU7037686.1 CoB--CoM heterodisulfide reductase iron-sulfur subunit A family protein [Theionarchaea archaeon]
MVVGGGIAGMQASLDLADSGFRVYLVDKAPTIGGVMAQLDKTFPTLDCSMCIMAPKLVATGRHHNIHLLTNAVITNVEGTPGNFTVTVTMKPRYVNAEKCTGCGLCAQYCPVEAVNEYDERLTLRRGIYVDYPQAVPLVYAIDREKCIGCGLCENICQAEAIEYHQTPEEEQVNVGAIILAAGFDEFEPDTKKEYGYGRFKNVVTATEFERILSASGPFAGHVVRPSDGEVPGRIAFLQCVGSRDENSNKYCSAVCCMYATKEAIIAKEHNPDLEATIFFMDMRTYGKGFEQFYKRAQSEYGLRYTRSRVPCIEADPETQNLLLTYETEDGTITKEEFDMVVLSVGLEPPKSNQELSSIFGVPLNEYGFLDWKIFEPLKAKDGIYACGAFSGPKDIPDTVAQASGAAAMASGVVSGERGTLVEEKVYPEELDVAEQPPRIGVFVCWCGINIGGIVNVPEVMEYASTLPNVVFVDQNLYTCSQDTQEKIKQAVEEHSLNRVVVASCTPRTHEPLFQSTIREAGLNPYLFEMTNIRDQCSWVHMHTPEEATEKAKDLVRMAVAKSNLLEPLKSSSVEVTQSGLVIGGGIAGMTAALGLAQQGFTVHLVEKEDHLGGLLRDIRYTVSGEDPQEYLTGLEQSLRDHPNVTIHTQAVVEKVEGYVGNFTTTLSSGEEINHGICVIAVGGQEHKPTSYLYGEDKRVITQLEFEDMLSKGVKAKTVVMINCVESRDDTKEYCSRVCCSEAVKNALQLREQNPDATIYILYRDMRTYAFREQYYDKAREAGVVFMRYDPETKPRLEKKDKSLVLYAHDSALDLDFELHPDLVVLSTGVSPYDNSALSQMLKVPLDRDGFFLEAHMKLRPVDFATDGVFMAGLAHSPKFIDETISQAFGTVARACTIVSKERIETEPIIAEVDEELCCGCQVCIPMCPYNARELDEEEKIVKVNEVLCKGCGSCVAACPSKAAQQRHFRDSQLSSMIEAFVRR